MKKDRCRLIGLETGRIKKLVSLIYSLSLQYPKRISGKNEYQNYILAEFKKLANSSFGGNVKAAYKPALSYIDASKMTY